ncbi:MAG: hypothetical protein ACR2FX_06735 [Chthoniobacterales bacterium]
MTKNSSAAAASVATASHRAAQLRFVVIVAGSVVVWLGWINWPLAPTQGIDPSAQLVLGYAYGQRWQFGPEILFTHGPWSFLKLAYCYPPNFWEQIAWRVLFHALVAASVAYLALSLPMWRGALLITAAALLLPLFDDVASVLLIAFLFATSLRRQLPPHVLLIAAVTLAFLALQKFTYLTLASVAAAGITALLLIRGRRRNAGVFVVILLVSFCLFWLAAGQQLRALPIFLSRSWQVVSLYSEAMFLDESPAVFWCGMLVLLTAAIALGEVVWRNRTWSPATRSVVGITIIAFGFLLWKHAFVRADGHVQGFFLCALGVGLVLPRHFSGLTLAAAALVGFGISSPKLLAAAPALLGLHISTSLRAFASPAALHARFIEAAASAANAARLPQIGQRIGQNAVDVFGNDAAVAVLNRFSYQPRPVFQSYEACSPALAQINAAYYARADAPRFVLSRGETVDNRFLAADDPRLLILLLQQYRCTIDEHGWSLLECHETAASPFQPLTPIRASLGQTIPVPHPPNTLIKVQIDVRPSRLGRLRTLLYKSAELILLVDDGGGGRRYRLIRPAARGGFLINPLLRDSSDYRALWHGAEHVARSLTVDVAPSARKFYRANFSLTFASAPRPALHPPP